VTVTTREFTDRRAEQTGAAPGGRERRQFISSREGLSEEARELAEAIDSYKLEQRRRYITIAEVLEIVKSLGYHK